MLHIVDWVGNVSIRDFSFSIMLDVCILTWLKNSAFWMTKISDSDLTSWASLALAQVKSCVSCKTFPHHVQICEIVDTLSLVVTRLDYISLIFSIFHPVYSRFNPKQLGRLCVVYLSLLLIAKLFRDSFSFILKLVLKTNKQTTK